MANVNKVILVGNLVADPETRYTRSGAAVANFRVATNEQWTSKQTGEKRERSEFHRIVTFNGLAESCSNYLTKGRQVYVEGRLRTNKWEDRDGNKRYTTEIEAQIVQFLGSKSQDTSKSSKAPEPVPTASQDDSSPSTPPITDDDVPF